MSKNVIILTGSARPNSAGKNVAATVKQLLDSRPDVVSEIIEPADLNLPFYNAETSPSDPSYQPTNPLVVEWGKRVASADAVIWVMPEYNNSMSGIQKNAIDWLFAEWNDKPLSLIGYGWYDGANILANAKIVSRIVRADVRSEAGLGFKNDISTDGSSTDPAAVEAKINQAIDALLGEKSD